MKTWTATPQTVINEKSSYVGLLQINNSEFTILKLKKRLLFGGTCNAGFIESGYIEAADYESLDETLQELHEELETFYRDGGAYTNRIVYNERM